jgi:hypothetical protein
VRALFAAVVLAYVMPAYSVLRNVANARDKLELVGIKVEGTAVVQKPLAETVATGLNIAAPQGELATTMTVAMRVPGRCRVELSSPESTKVVAAVNNNGRRRTEGPEVPALQVLVDELCATLALRSAGEGESRAALEKHLRSLKVDVGASALGRFEGKIAYVVGGKEPTSAQFWAYKEKFDAVKDEGEKLLPARVKFSDDRGSWDVRLIDYTTTSTGDAFPRVVEVYKNDALQLRLTSLNAELKPKLDEKLF